MNTARIAAAHVKSTVLFLCLENGDVTMVYPDGCPISFSDIADIVACVDEDEKEEE